MSARDAREYLTKIRNAVKSMNYYESRIKFYESEAERCTAVISDMPKGSMRSTEDLYAKLIDLKKEYAAEIEKRAEDRATALILIESLKNDRYKVILTRYYIEGRDTLFKASEGLNLSTERIKKLHIKALQEFDGLLKGEL